jgi:hypothetical protein
VRLDHPRVRLRLVQLALAAGVRDGRRTAARRLGISSHEEAAKRAVVTWQWRQLDRRHRRAARRIIHKTRRRYPWTLRLEASIASPVGMGNDGKKAYDLSTRTWFGNFVGALQASGNPIFSVSNPIYAGGATGNGTTDDSAAIMAATTAANPALNNAAPATGGIVFFFAGVFIAENLTIPTAVMYVGAGMEATILKLKNSAGTTHALLSTVNFDGLVGTNPVSPNDQGPWNFGLRDITLDGNKASNGANTATAAVRFFGYGWHAEHMRIRNSATIGWWSEWSSSAAAPALGDAMEARVFDVKVHDSTTHDVVWNGPHDSDVVGLNAYNTGSGSGRGIWVQANGNGLKATNCHSWGASHTYAWFIEGTATQLIHCEGEGATGGAQVFAGANDLEVMGGTYFAAAGSTTGFVIGDGTHLNILGTYIATKILNCTTAAISFAQDRGSIVICNIYQTAGPAYTGTPDASSVVLITINGGGTHPGNQLGNRFVSVLGAMTVAQALTSQGAFQQSVFAQTTSGAVSINPQAATVNRIILNGNMTSLAIAANPADGTEWELQIVEDGTGGRTIPAMPATLHFSAAGTPVWSTAANTANSVKFRFNGTNHVEVSRAIGMVWP